VSSVIPSIHAIHFGLKALQHFLGYVVLQAPGLSLQKNSGVICYLQAIHSVKESLQQFFDDSTFPNTKLR
jgi:hypothetical protein